MRTKEDYEFHETLQILGNNGIRKAREAAQKAGLPIAYSINRKLFWQLPDGSVTDDKEYIDKLYEELEKKLTNLTTPSLRGGVKLKL